MVVDSSTLLPHHNQTHDHIQTAFPQCARPSGIGAVGAFKLPPRDGPIVPSNCNTRLTCQPIHPMRNDPWGSISAYVGDWLGTAILAIGGTAIALGACVYGKAVIDRNRQRKRDARLSSEGRRPPGQGESDEDSDDDDLRGQRG